MQTLSEQILERAATGILCLDLDGCILFANPAAARLLGCADPNELIGQPVRTYIQFLSTASSGEDRCIREDGSSFPIEYESSPLTEAEDIVGTVLTIRDITRRRAIDRRNKELISIVSHELRTPLTSIRGALGLLAGGLLGRLTDQGTTMVDIAVNSTDRLIRLISDMLDLERVDSGEVRMRRVPCRADQLMADAADSVRGMAEAAGVLLELTPVQVVVPGDPDRLQQVLINLLANAIKFSPSGGGTVWLDVERQPGELVFRVRDEGRGIPPDKLESVFERFIQVDDSDAREKGGTGLGLAISRAIVKQHGGHIWAESTYGAGTTLCVALPADETAYAPMQQVERAA